ncbi:MAG: PASTA domain-containing protein, partial [Chloroflexi bacterium]|nr:PASTA domain-containing protein [Chloroflexota bacterium]
PWWMWLLAVLAVFLLGAIGFLAVQLLGGLGGSSATPSPSVAQVTVPDCDDVSLARLQAEAADLGLTVDRENEASEDVDEGDVIRCEPGTGLQVDEGSPIIAFVSSGADAVPVPGLRGQNLQQATETLREAGFSTGNIEREPDASVPDGSVIRSIPTEGVDHPRGEQVDLVLSTGLTPSPTASPTASPTPTPVPTPVPTPFPTPVPTGATPPP